MNSKQLDFDAIHFETGPDAILGKGSFGIVRRARYMGETVAVKQVKLQMG